GLDANSNAVNGTPRVRNSVTSDTTTPAAVTDLVAYSTQTVQGILLNWTSPSEDHDNLANNTGGHYIVRFATYSIAALSNNTTDWWNSITASYGDRYRGERNIPNPANAGVTESKVISELYPNNTYWFAIKVYDAAGNVSLYDDNSFSAITQASATVVNKTPAAIAGLAVPAMVSSSIQVTWTANTEIDVNKYWLYRSASASAAPTTNAFTVVYATVTGTNSCTDSITDVSLYYSYWIKAVDDFGLLSTAAGPVSATPDNQPPVITHTPITQRDLGKDTVVFSISVTDNIKVSGITVYCKSIPEGEELTVNYTPPVETASVSADIEVSNSTIMEMIGKQGLKYQISAADSINTALTDWYEVTIPLDEPEQKFMTPSNPEVIFGSEAEEVVITDVRGNRVFSKKKDGSPFIVWNPSEGGKIKIESGLYIYRIKTADGEKYGPVIIAK
ncbi:MAG: hypothetical protein ABIH89_11300, partial [Elusimicrobiota bacterium]